MKSLVQAELPIVVAGDNKCDQIFENQEWLNHEEAAAYLRLSPGALRNLVSNGQVPHYKLGRRNRYLKSELKLLLLTEKRGVSR